MDQEYIDFLEQKKWVFKKSTGIYNIKELNQYAKGRLQYLESSFFYFLNSYDVLANDTDDVWFIPLKSYSLDFLNDDEFTWNEFENQSLEYADSDEEKTKISSFWKNHLPFIYSVKDGYAYIAIILKGENKGKIVFGREPEYEDVEIISNSFKDFQRLHFNYLRGEKEAGFLSSFV